MSTLSDQLNEHFDKMDAEGGMSTLHLLSLPKAINRVLRLFLKHKEISREEILTAVDAMPEGERLSPEEVDEVLGVLLERDWLMKIEEGAMVKYGINLRPAVASATTKATGPKSDSAGKAEDAWNKAGIESMGAPKETASQMHSTMMTATKKEEPEEKQSEEAESTEKTKKDTGSLSADDLWKALD